MRTGEAYQYVVVATDAEADALSYALTTAPTGMTLTGNTINWSPNVGDAGSHPVEVQVSDGSSIATQLFSVSVASNVGLRGQFT